MQFSSPKNISILLLISLILFLLSIVPWAAFLMLNSGFGDALFELTEFLVGNIYYFIIPTIGALVWLIYFWNTDVKNTHKKLLILNAFLLLCSLLLSSAFYLIFLTGTPPGVR